MLNLHHITLSRGPKILLEDASVTLYEKQKIGLVGLNGCGKSSLFALIRGELTADEGECLINPNLTISHLAQHTPTSDESALEFILAGDEEYIQLMAHLKKMETSGNADEVLLCHEKLKQTEGYSKPAKASRILAGLGFKTHEHALPVHQFSGGWRMRLNLARALMKPAALLLLDEPTNHLDLDAILWLEKWLKHTPSSVLVISHDRDFLDSFVSHILHVHQQQLHLYAVNYSAFERIRAEQLVLQQKKYEKQQHKIQTMQQFIARFRAKASKAKQAQSRLNALSKMEITAQAHWDSPFSFQFMQAPRASNPLLQCKELMVGYAMTTPIINKGNISLEFGERVALLGANGAGKSTFIKTLTGLLPPLAGSVYHAPKLNIGYYAQHQLEHLDKQASALETIQRLDPQIKEQNIRDFLGSFHFIGDDVLKPIHYYSGGEKARLALAKIVWQKPNLLLLDEPTNHLDLTMRSALEIALMDYTGTLILISHDRHLLRTTVDRFYLLKDQRIEFFQGDLEDYTQALFSSKSTETTSPASSSLYREKKRLQNQSKKLEKDISDLQQELLSMDLRLSESDLYEPINKLLLENCLHTQAQLKTQLSALEEEWLDVLTKLEQ